MAFVSGPNKQFEKGSVVVGARKTVKAKKSGVYPESIIMTRLNTLGQVVKQSNITESVILNCNMAGEIIHNS